MIAEKIHPGASSRIVLWILGGISLALFAYVAIRSSTLCFTIDEAFTFQRYVKNSNFFPAEYDMHTANFHMLNTWLMIICSKLFGIAEWSLRLPNVLAYVLYLFFTAKFALRSKQTWNIVAVFVLLNVHPYLLDFFSVARGYGLLFGFLAGSLWYLCEFFANGKQLKHLAFALLCAGLAMWANFSGLTVFLAIAAIVFFGNIFGKKITARRKFTGALLLAIIFIPFAAVAYHVISQLQQVNAFFWASDGFWNETVCVLGAKLAYPLTGDIYTIPHASSGVMLLVLLVPAVVVTYAAVRNWRTLFASELFILLAVLAIVLLQALVQHIVFQAPYPSGRTALFVYVIFLWILAGAIRDTMLPRRVAQIACAIIVPVLLVLVGYSFNFSRTAEWNYCADVRNGLREVVAKAESRHDSFGGVVVGHDVEFGNIISYYILRDQITNITLLPCSESADPVADYYIVSPYVRHKVGTPDTMNKYQPSELLVLRTQLSAVMKVEAASIINRPEKKQLQDITSNEEIFRYSLSSPDSVLTRVNIQTTLRFPQVQTQCVFQFWHERNSVVIWSGYYFVESFARAGSTVHTINRNFPLRAIAGDVIRVSIAPADSIGVPIEISQIKAHLQVAE